MGTHVRNYGTEFNNLQNHFSMCNFEYEKIIHSPDNVTAHPNKF